MIGSVLRTGRLGIALVLALAMSALGCGSEGDREATDVIGAASEAVAPTPDGRRFVLPATTGLSLIDTQVAASPDVTVGADFKTFSQMGSPDDSADGPGVSFGIADAASMSIDDVISGGVEIDVDNRQFLWVSEAENQRVYIGPTPLGRTIAMATLNVDEATAVQVLTTAELSGTDVLFDGQPTLVGWVDTGTLTTLVQFVSGTTGSSTPPGGMRALYGDVDAAIPPTWDGESRADGLTLATWPVSGTDPENEARYNLNGEIQVEVIRADGSATVGFSSAADSEFFDFLVWQDGPVWLALSRPVAGSDNALIDLASTVREANPDEVELLDSLAAD